jgi:16S rRNA (cytosine967-C5)-methyltransferase
MTPAARLQAAIEILQELETTALPADRFLRDWFRRRRYAGSKDRAAVAERVFDALRHRNAFAWRMQSETPRALVIGSLLHKGQTQDSIQALFTGEGYGPSPPSAQELHAIHSPPQGEPPLHVQGEYPQWLEPELKRAFGDGMLDEMRALQSRAPIDLRVNTLRANRGDVLEQLRAEGYEVTPTRHSPFAIRISAGASGLEKTQLFASGAFELQDEAAQIVALLVDAKPGMRVLDLAAGAGGKSLAIAAQMRNEGEIIANDIDVRRLAQIRERAKRAGVTIILPRPREAGERAGVRGTGQLAELPLTLTLSPNGGEGNRWFDRVLVDAPCSGTGTWRRQPELRWRLTPEQLEGRKKTQSHLLEDGARHIKPGGRLIYATCSILPCENEDQIAAFVERNADFVIRFGRDVWRESVGTAPPPGMDRFFHATPLTTGTDGFFVAVLERTA